MLHLLYMGSEGSQWDNPHPPCSPETIHITKIVWDQLAKEINCIGLESDLVVEHMYCMREVLDLILGTTTTTTTYSHTFTHTDTHAKSKPLI